VEGDLLTVIIMAIIIQSFDTTVTKFGFQGLDTAGQERSFVPRQEIYFGLNAVPFESTPAPDELRILVQTTLPFGFAYALTDMYLSVLHGDAGTENWDAVAVCSLRDSNEAVNQTYRTEIQGLSHGDSSAGEGGAVRVWTFDKLPSWVIIPIGANSVNHLTMSVSTFNDPGGVESGTVTVLIRAIQFDVAQAHHFQVNTPLLVR